jgi:hypothetical protein
METVTIKTCEGLQTFIWRNGALLRPEDQNEELRGATVAHSELSRILRMIFPEDQEASSLLREWIAFRWLYQHSPNPFGI